VVAVSFDRDDLVAGGAAAAVTARALDAGGNVVPAELELDARGAILTEVRVRRPGEVVARAEAGSVLLGDEAVVTATAATVGIAGSRSLPLRPAEAAEALFEGATLVRSDGAREAVLQLSVADRFGNAVSAVPAVSAARGRVVSVAAVGRGEYAIRYVGPAVDRAASDELVARVGTLRATAAPLLAPPEPALLLSARAGLAGDARSRFGGATAGVAVERPADVALAVRHGAEVAWRLEAEGLAAGGGASLGALLAGASVRRGLGGRAELSLAASAGAVLGGGGASPGARLALAFGVARRWGVPFVEASVLGATGAPEPFAALGLSAGVRFGWETPHGHDPHRR
jgi:hypothetical protein